MTNEFLQSIGVEKSQNLVMTPQLRQAITLLAMSYDELNQFVSNQIEINPFLELESRDLSPYPEKPPLESKDEVAYENIWPGEFYDQVGKYNYAKPSSSSADDGYSSPELFVKSPTSLIEHLSHLIGMHFSKEYQRKKALDFVAFLDDRGFLSQSLDSIAEHLNLPLSAAKEILLELQKINGNGLFARSLGECFKIQLAEKNDLTPQDALFLDHMHLMLQMPFDKFTKNIGLKSEEAKLCINKIKNLTKNPLESLEFLESPLGYPPIDLILTLAPNNEWSIQINRQTIPKVRIENKMYDTFKSKMHKPEDIQFMKTKMYEGNHLIKAIEKRVNSILSVGKAIVEEQIAFLKGETKGLKPLKLKDIAAKVELHESTVSRVTQNKYIQTPLGVFELKYFFSSSIISLGEDKNTVSSQSIKGQIEALIKKETMARPLSDDTIAKILNKEGILIARRTVTKYREALSIPSASLRKKGKILL